MDKRLALAVKVVYHSHKVQRFKGSKVQKTWVKGHGAWIQKYRVAEPSRLGGIRE
jgi:hypothetical protein